MQGIQGLFAKGPSLSWYEIPTENTKGGDDGKYDTCLYKWDTKTCHLFTNYNTRGELTKLNVGTVTGKKNGEIETCSFAETINFVSQFRSVYSPQQGNHSIGQKKGRTVFGSGQCKSMMI